MSLSIKGIIGWVKRHERIHYIMRAIQYINNDSFVHDFMHIYNDLNIIRIKSNGNEHKGKILQRISGQSKTGFFANMIYVLFQMWFSDSLGMFPVVVWGEESPYYEVNGVDGVYNVWEYYFLQYNDLKERDLNLAFRYYDDVKDVRKLVFGIENGYRITEEAKNELARIMRKYVRLRPDIESYIDRDIRELLNGRKTLGVQIRMGSMLGKYDNHPIVPSMKEYIEKVKNVFYNSDAKYEQIFLATDDKRVAVKMKKIFKDMVVFYEDVTRVEGICETYDAGNGERHNYLCGLEVLRDAYTLKACDGLVMGLSQVGAFAEIAKRAYNEKYEDLVVLDKGIYHKQGSYRKKYRTR